MLVIFIACMSTFHPTRTPPQPLSTRTAVACDVVHEVDNRAACSPDAVAIVDGGICLTYAALRDDVARVDAALRARDIGPGDIVAVSLRRGAQAITVILGILRAGAAWLPLDREDPASRRSRVLEVAAPLLELSDADADADLGPAGSVPRLIVDDVLAADLPDLSAPVEGDGEDPAYVIVTSGSTGEPKPVVVPRRALRHYCRVATDFYRSGPDDRVLQFSSLSFDASIEEMLLPLCVGAAVVVRNDEMIGHPARFLETCTKWGITVLGLPPAYWLELLVALDREEAQLPPSLRMVILGGETVRPEAVRRWLRHAGAQVRLVNSYGPTETTVVATVAELGNWREGDVVKIGYPLPGVSCRIADADSGADVDEGEGELWIGGPGVASGYLGDPDLTVRRFVDSAGRGREFRTGDRVRRHPDGSLEHLGRLDRQVKVRGFRVEPAEVEAVLVQAPGVLEAAVQIGDRDGRPILRAHVLVDGAYGRPLDLADVRAYVTRELPAFMRPHAIVGHDRFPRTVSGKTDYAALARSIVAAPGNAQAADEPGDEAAVRRVWSELLGVDRVTADDHFFEQGGDSLAAIRLVTRLHREHDLTIGMTDVLARPLFAEVVAAIRRSPVTPIDAESGPTAEEAGAKGLGTQELTPLQRDFVVTEHLVELPVHTLGIRYRLPGRFEPAHVRHLLRRLARRHPALRQRLIFDGDQPRLLVAESDEVSLTVVDLPAGLAGDLQAQRTRREATLVPFDLVVEPPVRALLLRAAGCVEVGDVTAGDDELVIVVHHLGFDGWSVALLGDDLGRLIAEREPSDDVDADCGVREAAALSSLARLDRAAVQRPDLTDYWRNRLAGVDTSWTLPTDRPRPAHRSFAVERTARVLDPVQLEHWHEQAQRHHTSLFVVGLAAVQTLVQRYTGVTDVTVLAPTSRRGDPGTAELVGPVVSVLPFRGDLGGDPTTTGLVTQLARSAVEDLIHQDLPIPAILAAAAVPASRGRNQITTISLSLHNLPEPTTGGVRYAGDEPPAASMLDLAVSFDVVDDRMVMTVDYATELFDEQTAVAFGDHLVALLDAGCRTPEVPISRLPMLSEGERREILDEHQGSDLADIDVPDFHGVHEYVEMWAGRNPDAPALLLGGTTVSYRELDAAADGVAHRLVAAGAGPGVLVGICLNRDRDLFVSVLAVLKTGAAYLPLDPAYPAERLAMMLSDSDAGMLLTREDVPLPPTPKGVEVYYLDRMPSAGEAPRPDRVAPGAPAYMIYTSGSTGTPKGVVITHDRLIAMVAGWQDHYGLCPEWGYLQVASFSFDMFVAETLRGLCSGGRLVVAPREVLLQPESLANLIDDAQVNFFELVPAVLRRLLHHLDDTGRALPSMRVLIGGGEKWHVGEYRLARQIVGAHARVANAYGVTEVTVDNTVFEGEVDELPDDAPLPIGRPFAGHRSYVLDAHREPVPHGVVGELYLGGFGVADGYHRRPELTAQRFLADPARDGGGLYRTGDSARRRRDGDVEFLGRLDDQVKIDGHRIELGEIEAVLAAIPGVQAAAVSVHTTARGISQLVGHVVTRVGVEAMTADRLRSSLAGRLPRHMVPAQFLMSESLPVTQNGKLDRHALPPPPDRQTSGSREAGAPLSPAEQRVAGVWAEVLDLGERADLRPEDDFFALGGDSFAALRVVRRLDGEVTLIELYQTPTVGAVAALLTAHAPRAGGVLHRLTMQEADVDAGGVTVVAVPYSGGNAIAYRPLALALPDTWALYAVELPGHDPTQPDESLLSAEEVANLVVDDMAGLRGPLMLYGHCLGVAVTLEVARLAEARGLELTGVGLGAAFPTARLSGRVLERVYRLLPTDRFTSDRELLAYLRGRGGFTDLSDRADIDWALRRVRHDARDAERYFSELYRDPVATSLRAPVRSIVGARDRVTEHYGERVNEWRHVAGDVDQAVLPDAGHFFVATHAGELASTLTNLAAPRRPPATAVPENRSEPRLGLFALVTAGQVVSMVGSGLSSFVLALWVFAQTGSVGAFAVLSAVGVLPGLLLGPLGGVVADRFDRRRVMIVSDTGSAVAVAGLAVLVLLGGLSLWQVLIAVTVTSIAGAFQRPAYLAAVAQMVPKRYLGQANGISQIGVGVSAVVGPMLGAALYAFVNIGGVLLFDLATFLVGVTTLLLARIPDLAFRRREESFRAEITHGWSYVTRRPGLRAALWFFTVDQLLFAVGFAVIIPMLLIEHSPAAAGIALSVGGVGGLVGALVMGLWGGTPRRMHGVIISMAGASGAMALAGAAPALWCATIGLFGLSFGVALAEAQFIAMIQTKVGFELQGRVLALYLSVMMLASPIAYLVVAPLADPWVRPLLVPDGPLADTVGAVLGTGPGRGLALLVVVSGFAQFAWACWGWRNKTLRDLEDSLPDALPPARIQDKDAMQRAADEQLTAHV